MLSQHTVSAFEEDMNFLKNKIAEMGGHAEKMIVHSVQALIQADVDLAKQVVKDDLVLDDAQREIDDKAVLLIAQRQPMANDLREVFANIRIAGDLERIGDMAKGIGKRVSSITEYSHGVKFARGLEHLNQLALEQLNAVLNAYGTREVGSIEDLRERDEEIDAMYTSLFRELLTYMMEDPRNITTCTQLLFCAKNIERIGDHATNIAEDTYYMVEGKKLDNYRPKEDKTHRVNVDQ